MNTGNDLEKSLQRRVKRHVKAPGHTFFAVVQPGFEQTAAAELKNLEIQEILHLHQGGITFRGSIEDCYRLNICARTITRILMRIDRFKSFHFNQLYRRTREIPWELLLPPGCDPQFGISSSASRLYHTGRIEEEAFRAISERMSKVYGNWHPCDEKEIQPQTVYIRIEKNTCTLSLDSSGEPLYKRGYKDYVTEAPIRETTASALLYEADIYNADVIIDPMCGSGTFSLEAGMILQHRIPGCSRKYPFYSWPVFSRASFDCIHRNEAEKTVNTSTRIICSDVNPKAVQVAERNIQSAGLDDLVDISVHDFLQYPMKDAAGINALCMLNPPYGRRVAQDSNIYAIYEKLGMVFREWYPEWGYMILFPDEKCIRAAKLPFTKKITFPHGGIQVTALFHPAGVREG